MIFLSVILLSAAFGSFLTVVIDRYPLILLRQWGESGSGTDWQQRIASLPARFSLSQPASHCQACQQDLRWYELVPILSFLLQRGRCRHCQYAIGWHVLLIELLAVVLAIASVLQFGFTLYAAGIVLLGYFLLIMAAIDTFHQILPDSMTLSLLWCGLVFSVLPGASPISPASAIIGALFGYLLPWGIAKGFWVMRRQEGIGLGDCKLLAAMGAWGGVMTCLGCLLMAALLGVVVIGIRTVFFSYDRQQHFAFGPFIALAGFLNIWALFQCGHLAPWLAWLFAAG